MEIVFRIKREEEISEWLFFALCGVVVDVKTNLEHHKELWTGVSSR